MEEQNKTPRPIGPLFFFRKTRSYPQLAGVKNTGYLQKTLLRKDQGILLKIILNQPSPDMAVAKEDGT